MGQQLRSVEALGWIYLHALGNDGPHISWYLQFLCEVLLLLVCALEFDGHLHALGPVGLLGEPITTSGVPAK